VSPAGRLRRRPTGPRRDRASLHGAPRRAARPRPAAPRGRLRSGRIGAAVLALSFAAGAGLAERVAPVPRVVSLWVEGAPRLPDAELAGAAGVARGDSLLAVDAVAVAARLAAHPWVRSARVARLPSGRIVVSLEEREARAVLLGQPARAVDADGTPFARVEADAFPELPRVASEATAADDAPNEALAAAVRLAERLAALGLPPAEQVALAAPGDPAGSCLRLRGLAPRFLLGTDADAALPRLAKLVDAGPPEVLLASTVDLRFRDQAVLSHEPLPDGGAQAAEARGGAAPSGGRRSG
jgi:hypothetical protein